MESSVFERHQKEKLSRAVPVRFFTCSALALAGVLVLILVYAQSEAKNGDLLWKTRSLPEDHPGKHIDGRFQFLLHMNKSMISHYQGGDAQWAGYNSNSKDYLNPEEVEFGNCLNSHQSQMSLGTLRIKGGGLRVPNWNLNSNMHGFVAQGTVWIGVLDDNKRPVTYTATTGKVIFLPRNTLYWIKNTGRDDCKIVLFFTTLEKPSYLDLDDLFYSVPKDLLANVFEHRGGMKFIEQFKKPGEDQSINLPPDLSQLTKATTYQQSASSLVRKYCLDLEGTSKLLYRGGAELQWSWADSGQACLHDEQNIFTSSLLEYPDTLNVGKLRFPGRACLLPQHANANQMGYVLTGCGKVGVFGNETIVFEIGVGDSFFFPAGSLYYINNTCKEELTVVLAHRISDDLNRCNCKQNPRKMMEAVFLDEYFDSIPPNVLAQLFLTNENVFTKVNSGSHTKLICPADITGQISTVAPKQSTVSNRATTRSGDVLIINSGAITNNSNAFNAVTPKHHVPAGESNEDMESEIAIILDADAVTPKHQVPSSISNEDNESEIAIILDSDAAPPKSQVPSGDSNEDDESEIVIIHDSDAVNPKHQAPSSDSKEDDESEIVIVHDSDAVNPNHQAPSSESNKGDDSAVVIVHDSDAVNPNHQAPSSDSNKGDESAVVIVHDSDAVNLNHQAPSSDSNKGDESAVVIVQDSDAVNPNHQAPSSDSNKGDESAVVLVHDSDAVIPNHQAPSSDSNKGDESAVVIIHDQDAVNPKHQAPSSDANEDDDSVVVIVHDSDSVNPKHQAPSSDANEDDESAVVIIHDQDAVNPKHQAPSSESNKGDDSAIIIVHDKDAVTLKHQVPSSDTFL